MSGRIHLKTVLKLFMLFAFSWQCLKFIHQRSKMDQALSIVNKDLERDDGLQAESTTVMQHLKKEGEKQNKKGKAKRANVEGEIEFSKFTYPLNVDMDKLVHSYRKGIKIQEKPINEYKYSFITPHRKHCKTRNNRKSLSLILVIKSAIANFENRASIRDTWGNDKLLQKLNVKRIFTVGMSKNTSIEASIKTENEKFNDILQANFIDNYQNNTLKTIGSINWMARFCSKSRFVFMLDDDFFVAIENVMKFLKNIPASKEKDLFSGVLWDDPPQRSKKQKWRISVKDYPYNKYPPFISAGAMLMSMDLVQRLHIAIPYTRLFKFDDVYLGIVAHKLKVTPQNNKHFHVHKVGYDATEFRDVLASHGYNNASEMRKAWEIHSKLQNGKVK